jgi:hypothetical protein
MTPVHERTSGTQRELNPALVVPANVFIQGHHEVLHSGAQPVPRVEQLDLKTTDEALADSARVKLVVA